MCSYVYFRIPAQIAFNAVSIVRIFLNDAVNRDQNAAWSDYPNKNVFCDRLNKEYDKSAFRKSDGKLFQSLMAAAAKVLSAKQQDVRRTVSILISAEGSCLARASVTSWQYSAR